GMVARAGSADHSGSMGNEPRQEPHENPGRPHPRRRRTRGHAGAATPVVRLDIYASSEGRGATPVSATPETGPEDAGIDRRWAELDRRKTELDQSQAKLEQSKAELHQLKTQLEQSKTELDRRNTERGQRKSQLE